MSTNIGYYFLFYCVLLVSVIVGAYLKVVPIDIVLATFTFILGHGTGVVTPVPADKTVKNG